MNSLATHPHTAKKTHGRRVLITGASSGIGEAIAVELASRGDALILTARQHDKLQALAQTLRGLGSPEVSVLPFDLTDPQAPRALFQKTQDLHLSVDLLINNAGFGDFGEFIASDLAKTERMIQLNITALTALTRLYAADMVQRGSGGIVQVASTAAFQPGPWMAVYYATKAYVLSFAEALSVELAPTGVWVQVLCPGPTQSGFQEAAQMELSQLVAHKTHLFPTSLEVARYLVKQLGNGQVLLIHGVLNRTAALSTQLLPRTLTRKMMGWIQKRIRA